uniref:TraB domain-containing protein n=1 Tax=Amphimedon queenslandica TaxID=400682 RepID=A0A1X7TNY9_AMPQE
MASEGQVAGLTHAVFIKISANLMDKLGVAPGGEFRMGFQEGTKVGSTILLGDRSIRMTFKRALRALPIWQQLRLFYMLFTSVAFDLDISPEDIEKMKNSDMVEMLTGELAAELPALSHVFVNERDLVLANSLMAAANCLIEPYAPPVTIVGIVGIGHVNGIKEHWMKEEARDISKLLTLSPPHWSSRIFWTYVQFSLVSLVNVGLYWFGRSCLRAAVRKLTSST